MYNITSSLWTWISGNNTVNANGFYGTKGVPSVNNYPSGGATLGFDPVQNCIYLHNTGGTLSSTSFMSTSNWFLIGTLNDLWMYNISSTEWTWVSSGDALDVYTVYGTKGIPSANSYPGSRWMPSIVYVHTINCIYVFGGHGYARTTTNGVLLSHADHSYMCART